MQLAGLVGVVDKGSSQAFGLWPRPKKGPSRVKLRGPADSCSLYDLHHHHHRSLSTSSHFCGSPLSSCIHNSIEPHIAIIHPQHPFDIARQRSARRSSTLLVQSRGKQKEQLTRSKRKKKRKEEGKVGRRQNTHTHTQRVATVEDHGKENE